VICHILKMHVHQSMLDEKGLIDQSRIDLVGRMGGDTYCRAHGQALFEVEKPLTSVGIGVDQLPADIRWSPVLTGNDLGRLGNLKSLPEPMSLDELSAFPEIIDMISNGTKKNDPVTLHQIAKNLIANGEAETALKLLLSFQDG
jgi:hypothetical protein